MDTVHPVKLVDTVGFLQVSSKFVRSLHSQNVNLLLTLPIEAKFPSSHFRAMSEQTCAGHSIMDEVVILILQHTMHNDMDT